MTQIKELKTKTTEEWVVVKVICNGCRKECPKDYGLFIREHGGFDSTALLDCTSYEFDLCEECFVNIMDGLKVPPRVLDMHDGEMSYADDRKIRREMNEIRVKSKSKWDLAIERGVCPWTQSYGPNDEKLCGGIPAGSVDGTPSCERCLANKELSEGKIERFGFETTLQERVNIALRYLNDVRAGSHVEVDPRFYYIYESTAILMLVTDTLLAAKELERLVGYAAPEQSEWVRNCIAGYFPLNRIEEAKIANNWLAWAEEHGYTNAAACIYMNYTPEKAWRYCDPTYTGSED